MLRPGWILECPGTPQRQLVSLKAFDVEAKPLGLVKTCDYDVQQLLEIVAFVLKKRFVNFKDNFAGQQSCSPFLTCCSPI